MRKLLLMIMWSVAATGLLGQDFSALKVSSDRRAPVHLLRNEHDRNQAAVTARPVMSRGKKSTSVQAIGSSGNIFTLLASESSCLSANQETGVILFTYRGDEVAGNGTTKDQVVCSFSKDGGASWQLMPLTDDDMFNRYPSGVLYNTEGNTSGDKLYAVFCGATTDDDDWTDNYFGSKRLDNAHGAITYVPVEDFDQDFPRTAMTVCDDGLLHVLGYRAETNVAGNIVSFPALIVNNGIFNSQSNTIAWTQVELEMDFAVSSDGFPAVGAWNMAWSQDGKNGYVYCTGRDRTKDKFAYQPVIFKSTDGGHTWLKQKPFEFGGIEVFKRVLWPLTADRNRVVPSFSYENDAAVDYLGNLHIIGVVTGQPSLHPDSLDLAYNYQPRRIFDVHMTVDGWNARLVDTVWTETVDADDSGFGTGEDAVGWDHRVQVSRTVDGKKLFVSWADTDPAWGIPSNLVPNIKLFGVDLVNGTTTGVVNVTENTEVSGVAYWHYMSEVTLMKHDTYTVPLTVSPIHGSYSKSPLTSVTHYYLKGIELAEDDFSVGFAADAGEDITLCRGDSVLIRATGGVQYTWNTGSTEVEIIVSPTILTTYIVTASLPSGLTATDEVVVTILELPLADAGAGQVVCYGDMALLGAAGGEYYNWSNGGQNSLIQVAVQSDSVYFTVTVTDEHGCSAADDVLVLRNPQIKVDSASDTSITAGDTVSLQLDAEGGQGQLNYRWYVRDVLYDTVAGINISPDRSLIYTYVVADTLGCHASGQVLVMVDSTVWADAGPDQFICSGSSVELKGLAGPNTALLFEWSPAVSLDDAHSHRPVATPTTTTTYTLKVTGMSSTDTDGVIVVVRSLPDVDAGGNKGVCEGSSLSAKVSAGGGESKVVGYAWLPITGVSNPYVSNPVILVDQPSAYVVTVTDNHGCTNSDDLTIDIYPVPPLPFISQDRNRLISDFGASYRWYKDDVLLAGETKQYLDAKAYGVYQVEVTNDYGCVSQSYPYVFFPTSVSEFSGAFINLKVFPNPTNGILTLSGLPLNDEVIVRIYNVVGVMVFQTAFAGQASEAVLNLEEMRMGIYFVQVVTSNQAVVLKVAKD